MKLTDIRVLDLSQFLPGPHLTMMMDRRNSSIARRRARGDVAAEPLLDAEVLREASRARFEQLREREVNAERLFLTRF